MNLTTKPARGLSIEDIQDLHAEGFTLVTAIGSEELGEIDHVSITKRDILVIWEGGKPADLPLDQIRAVHRPEELISA